MQRVIACVLCACLVWASVPAPVWSEDKPKTSPQAQKIDPKEAKKFFDANNIFKGADDPLRTYFFDKKSGGLTAIGEILYSYLKADIERKRDFKAHFEALRQAGQSRAELAFAARWEQIAERGQAPAQPVAFCEACISAAAGRGLDCASCLAGHDVRPGVCGRIMSGGITDVICRGRNRIESRRACDIKNQSELPRVNRHIAEDGGRGTGEICIFYLGRSRIGLVGNEYIGGIRRVGINPFGIGELRRRRADCHV